MMHTNLANLIDLQYMKMNMRQWRKKTKCDHWWFYSGRKETVCEKKKRESTIPLVPFSNFYNELDHINSSGVLRSSTSLEPPY